MGLSSGFASVTALFFAWGFITANNDPLIAALITCFELSYTEALMIQLVSFAAFGLASLPAAALLSRVGAQRSILLALMTMTCGCLLVHLLTRFQRYELILLSLFVLGAGITTLQVAANPLAAALGPPERSHFRLTFAQAFNSLGVVIGVSFGSAIMLDDEVFLAARAASVTAMERAAALEGVAQAFFWMSLFLVALSVIVWFSRKQMNGRLSADGYVSPFAAVRSAWAVAGALAIGLYVGAEVSISSVMINFLHQRNILGVSLETAGFYLANIYWMGALIGRFFGSYLLTRISAPLLLGAAAMIASLLCLSVLFAVGHLAAFAALGVGLFNSIMFPTIFTIALERSRAPEAATSGLLCLAIAGGAFLPYTVGLIADHISLSASFVVPTLAYAAIGLFAVFAARAQAQSRGDVHRA